MNKLLSRRNIIAASLALLALLLLVLSSVSAVQAYFTTYTEVSGRRTVHARTELDIVEDVSGLTKSITLKNTGKYECWARALVLYPDGYTLRISDEAAAYWEARPAENGTWYVYKDVLPAGGTTAAPLVVGIEVPGNVPYEELKKEFNVVVISECVPVLYNENGSARIADWDLKFDVEETNR